jgi:hypothetical protein
MGGDVVNRFGGNEGLNGAIGSDDRDRLGGAAMGDSVGEGDRAIDA